MNRIPANPLIGRALAIAEARLGIVELSRRLRVAGSVIEDWRSGQAEIPDGTFIELVEILVSIDPAWAKSSDPRTAAKRIFVVDDHPGAAETIAELLRVMGHEANFTHDPREAVQKAKEMRAQIAFLDLSMPHIDGCALARLFRADPELKHACLIALTAYDDEKHRALTRAAGFDAHIKKPADPALLEHIVEHFGK